MNNGKNITDQVKILKELKNRGVFSNYINYIRFPYYRNLKYDTKIDFEFPLTVFVGPNGSGKSSCLQALYGAPGDNSTGDFWFETKVDRILEHGTKRDCFIYSFFSQDANRDVEIRKSRIRKKDKRKNENPDYWEPTRPANKMEAMPILSENTPGGKWVEPWKGRWKTRWEVLKKEVIYLDFRKELSAFDKYFYFITPEKRLKSKRKQDYLRQKSKLLKNVLEKGDQKKTFEKNSQYKRIRDLSKDELNAISFILGRNYSAAKIIEHKFFKEWGFSVIFHTDHFEYSEAFAGSGETAIVRLVTKILDSKTDALVLLDEPEVSLHPGAQRNLILFLFDQIKRKKLQVIISTHSPILISDLPNNAIKIFNQLPTSGKGASKNNFPNFTFIFRLSLPKLQSPSPQHSEGYASGLAQLA